MAKMASWSHRKCKNIHVFANDLHRGKTWTLPIHVFHNRTMSLKGKLHTMIHTHTLIWFNATVGCSAVLPLPLEPPLRSPSLPFPVGNRKSALSGLRTASSSSSCLFSGKRGARDGTTTQFDRWGCVCVCANEKHVSCINTQTHTHTQTDCSLSSIFGRSRVFGQPH